MHDTSVPRFNVHTTQFDPLPEYNGHQAWLYQSADGARRVGSFKEAGHYVVPMENDEFFYVIAGSSKVSVEGGESFTLTAGDCVYFRKGLVVTFDHDSDFHDVAVLMKHGDDETTTA
jgi:uncharacterized cupin superfamily protein